MALPQSFIWVKRILQRWKKGKAIPLEALDRPLELQAVEAPEFLDNRHLKVVWMSAMRTGRFHPPGKVPGTHFC
jgi:hypothetical protein